MQMDIGRNYKIVKKGTGVVTTIYPIEGTDQILFLIGGIMYDDGTEEENDFNITLSKFNCPDFEEGEIVKIVNNIRMVSYEEVVRNEYMKHCNICTEEEIRALIGLKEEYYQNPSYTANISIKKIPQKTNKIIIKI